ncbi:MAG: DUF2203 domain-containing protein [Phycisphaeraceae bacterium]|nr:DUF2203 domain-containing protein [Phycisphaeraceae bacterium]
MTTKPATVGSVTSPKRGKKYFTVEEANRAVPYITRIVTDITACYRQAVETRQRMEHLHPEEDAEVIKDEYENLMDRLNELLDELHQVGVELKDFEKGLVDFPAVYQGREIYLCWEQAEQKVANWHEIDAGFAGRQDLATLQR